MYFLEQACECRNQSPKKTSTCLKSARLSIYTKLPSHYHFLCFHYFQASLQLVPARSLNIVLYLLGSDLLVKFTEFQDAQKNQTSKSFHNTAEKVQDESGTHEESSCSDQEQDPEVFIQPSKVQLLPNLFMPYTVLCPDILL